MTYPHCYKTLQLTQLRTFCLVAAEGHFTAAARALGLSVPTVWQQVRSLEETVGTPLIHRRGRALEITPAGRLLLELGQPHVSGLDSLLPLFRTRCAELTQPLSIASTHYLVSYHLPQPVRELTRLFRSLRLQLHPGPWAEAIRIVERGQAHVGLVSYDPEEPRSAALDYEGLFQLQFTLLTCPGHPLAGRKRVRLCDLVEHPIILQTRGTYGHKLLERLLLAEGLLGRLHVVMESPSTAEILSYVAAGVGIALVYAGRDLGRQTPTVCARVFDPQLPGMPVALVTQKGAHLSAAAEGLRRLLRRYLAAGSNGRHH